MKRFAVCAALLVLSACGAPRVVATPPGPPPTPPDPGADRAKFEVALAAFVQHDAANDWDSNACASVAKAFESAGGARATFDAGLAWERCGEHEKARVRFEQAAKLDPAFDAAQARLAVERFRSDADLDSAIDTIQRAVAAGRFENVASLVDLATLEMARDKGHDVDDAKLNLQRALAIDDAFMPAFNRLALWHLAQGKKKHEVQRLELAALVCSQGIAKNASYAPLHNTAGLVHVELARMSSAAQEFGEAARLDPHFFEAQMNYAAVNLSYRGFGEAEQAYRRALALRPNDYDAHLGLALAMRGPMTGAEPDHAQRILAIRAEIDAAKRVDPRRPDAFYNEGILAQELEAPAGSSKDRTRAALDHAESAFKTFLSMAHDDPRLGKATARAKERLTDIAEMRSFL